MIDLGIIEKIRKVRDAFKKDGHPDTLNQIDSWEKRIKELSLVDDFVNLNTTQEIGKKLHSKIKDLVKEKAFKKGLTTETIALYDTRIDELKWMLELVTPSYEKEIEMIENELDNELSVL